MDTYLDIITTPWRLLDDVLTDLTPLGSTPSRLSRSRFPRVNAWEGEQGLILEADLPGVDPADLEVNVENNELTLKGKRTTGAAGSSEVSFERQFALPFAVDPSEVVAKHRLGVLTLTLPKAASAQKRKIAIEAA